MVDQTPNPPVTSEQREAVARLVAQLGPIRAPTRALPEDVAASMPTALVRRHLLGPLAYRAGLAEFRKDYIASALLAEVRAETLRHAVTAIARHSIPIILLKGISYASTLYVDPAERPMSDIDLLVPATKHADAARALRRLGYWTAGSTRQASRFHHAVCFKRKDAAIDLHRSIVQPYRSRIDIDALWNRASPAVEQTDTCRGGTVLRLDPVDEAVLHLAHIARHELRVPCINYVDSMRLIARIPDGRTRIMDRATHFRLRRGVAAALSMVCVLAGGEAALNQSHPSGIAEQFILKRILPGAPEVIADGPQTRSTQVLRKFALVDGPRELVGLLFVGAHGKLAHLFRA